MNVRRRLRRLGCAALLALWFLLLLTPCLGFVLVVQHEIVLTHSDLPDDTFRIWLIQQIDQRGIAFSSARRIDLPNQTACTVTDARFVLWQGQGAPTHFCSCYTRQADTWASVAEGTSACKMAGE